MEIFARKSLKNKKKQKIKLAQFLDCKEHINLKYVSINPLWFVMSWLKRKKRLLRMFLFLEYEKKKNLLTMTRHNLLTMTRNNL